MKVKLLFGFIAILCLFASGTSGNPVVNIVPRPARVKLLKGNFALRENMVISYPEGAPELQKIAVNFADRIRIAGGPALTVIAQSKETKKTGNIILVVKAGELPAEGYKLTVKPGFIQLTGGSAAGVFYGIQTLLQLLPPEVYGSGTSGTALRWIVPSIDIKDQPR